MPDMPRTKFNSPWTVANIEAELNGVRNARGSDSLADVLNSKAENVTVTEAVAELNAEIGVIENSGAKNVLKITERSREHNGVTFTVNSDESVSISGGTTGSNSFMRLTGIQTSTACSEQIPLPKGRYKISCPGALSTDNFRFAVGYRNTSTDARSTVTAQQSNDFEAEFEITTDTGRFDATVLSVSTDSNYSATVYPLIRRAEIKDATFVPYAPTNRELYEMILALQGGGNRALMMQTLQPTDSEEHEEQEER